MAAKIKMTDGLICVVKNKTWSCENSPEVAAALQQLTDEFLENSDAYHPDKDEAAANYAARLTGSKVIYVDQPEDLPAGAVA
jgi:hypothetical protein